MNIKNIFQRVWHSPTLMTWGSFAVKSINAVLILPLVLHKFTPEETAVWLLFLLFQNLLNLTDVGFTQSFSRSIAYAFGGADDLDYVFKSAESEKNSGPNWGLIGKIYKVMDRVYVYTSSFAFILMLTIGTYYMYGSINAIPGGKTQYWIAWGIMVTTSPFIVYGIKFKTYLIGTNRIAFVKRIDMLLATATTFCSIAIIIFAPSILWIVVNTQFWLVVTVIRDYMVIHKDKNLQANRHVKYEKRLFPFIWNSSWRSAIGLIGSYGIQQFTGIYFAQESHSPTAVASYLLSLRIMNTIVDFSRAPFYSKMPRLNALRAQGKQKELVNSAKKGMQITIGVFVLIVLIVGLFHGPILKLIKSKTEFVSNDVWALMCLAFFFERYGALHIQFYSITNTIIWHITNLVTGAIMLVLIFAGYKSFGIYILPLAMLISNIAFYSWYSAYRSYREFKMKFWQFERYILLIPGFSLVVYYLATILIKW